MLTNDKHYVRREPPPTEVLYTVEDLSDSNESFHVSEVFSHLIISSFYKRMRYGYSCLLFSMHNVYFNYVVHIICILILLIIKILTYMDHIHQESIQPLYSPPPEEQNILDEQVHINHH